MAPKRRSAAKAVVTAKKVVEETVQLVVSPDGDESERVKLISSSTKQDHSVRISPPPTDGEPPVGKSVSVQIDSSDTQPAATTPVRKARPSKPAAGEKRREIESRKQSKGKIASGEVGRHRRRRRRRMVGAAFVGGGEYKTYVHRVLKQVHPDMAISRKAMTIVNNLMGDMFERLAEEAARLQKQTGRRTMSSREVQGAVKLVLPGELGKHAIAEGTKAVTNYLSSG
ncbi:uncharacterized protein LOC127244470 [Andrographis paniculata]|uniref:uncharacterized protein LOC127244470 n=1 Tax=Andrographis paniculata TaxID=175694 RepID=UPI0021E8ED68|nr:uncharacterized protein LOC127244470 [Andrographis paniculata]